MFNSPLLRSVAQLVEMAKEVAGPDLDRPWAWGAYDSEGVR
jgi:hypothetical protein